MTQTQYSVNGPASDVDLYALAQSLARVAHHGQKRRGNGEDYFNHVARVAGAVLEKFGVRAATVAYLHDTIEDTSVTAQTLGEVGFPTHIIHDVTILTRVANEDYEFYIDSLVRFGSDDALHVKLADLADNLASLNESFGPNADKLFERYVAAKEAVLAELAVRADRRVAINDAREAQKVADRAEQAA